jgi:hypothetical protein
MNRWICALVVLAVLCGAGQVKADIVIVDLGTAAPPTTLGGNAMTPFGPDPQPIFTQVASAISLAPAATVNFTNETQEHVTIGSGWATWSNGYTGDVYANAYAGPDFNTIAMSLGTPAKAFYFYAEPNAFSTFNITVTDQNGGTYTAAVNGFAGANGFGLYGINGQQVASVTVTADPNAGGFAVGEFGIANPTPEPASLTLLGLGAAGLGGYLWRRRKAGAAVA